MTVEKLNRLEERIQKPGYLLLLVVVLLFLVIGFVDLIDDVSRNPVIFGLYSLKYFAILVVYTLGMLAWASLLLRPNDDRWLTKTLDFIQFHPPLAVGILVSIAVFFTAMLLPRRGIQGLAVQAPALQVTIFVVLTIFGGLILFYKWGDESRPKLWRKIVVIFLAGLLLVELVLQALAYFGQLPSLTTTRDSFSPYTRVYQSDEGLGSGFANNYGRYVPDFTLQPGSQRIALVGGPFLQALQIKKDQNLGVVLQEHIDQNLQEGERPIEILTLGYPDYGPGMYLSNWMLNVNIKEFKPEEAIVFFDLGSDFQTADGPGYDVPYFEYLGQGKVKLNLEAFFTDLHNAEHAVYRGHEGFQFVRALGSHYLTPHVALSLLKEPKVRAEAPAPEENGDIDLVNGFMFDRDTDDVAMLIAEGLIYRAQQQLARADAGISLVTIPVFTDAFYEQETWNTQFGDSDLLMPERELQTFAENLGFPFLGLGTYMAAQDLTPQQVQKLYYKDGRGHFTPEGHAFVAEAVYRCFFARDLPPEAGCDLR
jgi:hypothetical protein